MASASSLNFVGHGFRRGRPLHPWLLSLMLLSTLLAVPVICILLSVFLPSGDVWHHLYSTVLSSYVLNSL